MIPQTKMGQTIQLPNPTRGYLENWTISLLLVCCCALPVAGAYSKIYFIQYVNSAVLAVVSVVISNSPVCSLNRANNLKKRMWAFVSHPQPTLIESHLILFQPPHDGTKRPTTKSISNIIIEHLNLHDFAGHQPPCYAENRQGE
ncbi:hypothetical protein GGR54DRAFT_260003 [Hypoxylon sp. NC1633]|nr:hypothetical protein GGR54DRAFT_260003 [Hypoxylon sp. NC1633]